MKHLLRMFALLLLCSAPGPAQGGRTGPIGGTVKDQQGLPLPGATITATSPALQGERTEVSDAAGTFLFRAVPPGTYNLKAQLSGMATVEKTANVPLGGVAQLDLSMAISRVQESVTVSGETPTILST